MRSSLSWFGCQACSWLDGTNTMKIRSSLNRFSRNQLWLGTALNIPPPKGNLINKTIIKKDQGLILRGEKIKKERVLILTRSKMTLSNQHSWWRMTMRLTPTKLLKFLPSFIDFFCFRNYNKIVVDLKQTIIIHKKIEKFNW